MDAIDRLLSANARLDGPPVDPGAARPTGRLAVLTCMDARIEPYRAFGLQPGEAHLIRNAGAVASEDAIRSLVLSRHALGVTDVALIAHTRCGLLGLDEERLRRDAEAEAGATAATPSGFASFDDLDHHVRTQVRRILEHPWLARLEVRGLVYDVTTGRLREVSDGRSPDDSARRVL